MYKSGGQSDKDEVTSDSLRSVDLLKRLLMEVKVTKTFLSFILFFRQFLFLCVIMFKRRAVLLSRHLRTNQKYVTAAEFLIYFQEVLSHVSVHSFLHGWRKICVEA